MSVLEFLWDADAAIQLPTTQAVDFVVVGPAGLHWQNNINELQ
jgi:hypothetical protein